MKEVKQYNRAREAIEYPFIGLPNASGKLIQLLITRADPTTGIVAELSYRDLAELLTIDHAPGRKGAGVPKIDTIRSYLRTIAKSCSHDFKLISQGQKLKCQFINMPKIYASFCGQKELSIDEKGGSTLVENQMDLDQNCKKGLLKDIQETEKESTEAKAESSVKNIIYKLTKTKTNCVGSSKNSSKPISPKFHPSPEIIALALQNGFTKVTDSEEIQKFINYNLEGQTLWPDYNAVFLRWLERDKEHEIMQNNRKINQFKGMSHVKRPSNQVNSYESIMERARLDNAHAVAPSGYVVFAEDSKVEFDYSAHCLALDSNDWDLRSTLCK